MYLEDLEDILENDTPIELENGVYLERLGENLEYIEALETGDRIAGTPQEDMDEWHRQTEPYSCAIACQSFVAEQLLEGDFSESEMLRHARDMGIYDPETGTAASDVGELLENLGLSVERVEYSTLTDLAQSLEEGEKVICGVSSAVLACPELSEIPGIKADHAVQVIGIDATDPKNVQVILNDPGVENGGGIRHDLDTFLRAWQTGGNYCVYVNREVA